MFPLVLCLKQGLHAACQRVRRVHQILLWGMALVVFFVGFLVSSWCLVHVESHSFAGLPAMYKTWVTQVCLLLDMPFGQRSVGALPLQPLGRILKNPSNCLYVLCKFFVFFF